MSTTITEWPIVGDSKAEWLRKANAVWPQLGAVSQDLNNDIVTRQAIRDQLVSAAGATVWNTSTSYTQNVSMVVDPGDGRLYLRIGATGTTATAPRLDAAGWRRQVLDQLPRVDISTSTATLYEGAFFLGSYASGKQTLTLPTTGLVGASGISVAFSNGRTDNEIDFGSKKCNGGPTGVMVVRTPWRQINLKWVGGTLDWFFFAK